MSEPKGQTCLVQTAAVVPKKLETTRKADNKWILEYRPIVGHIYVIDGQVLKIETYIWLEIKRILKHV
jgi:hypothetical protein